MKPFVEESSRPNATASLNGSASAAPPVYRPNANPAVQRMKAPAVYRPNAAGTAQRMAAPPVYRPGGNQTQAKPAPMQSAPPRYRPGAGSAIRPGTVPTFVPSLHSPLQAKLGPIQPPASTRPPTCAPTSLKPPTAAFAVPQAVQRNKHKKRFLNVITFGIRKAYVKYKRNQQQHVIAPVNIVPLQAPQQNPQHSLKTAYDSSRKYHGTRPDNIESIVEKGLLNYTDQQKVLGNTVSGMSQLSSEYRGDEKKGVFLGARDFALENTKTLGTFVRTALPIERSNEPIGWWERDKPTGPDDGRLFRDEKFRGGGLYTPASVNSDLIWSGKTSALLQRAKDGDPTAQRKVQAMCRAIASHYPQPQPSWEEVREALAAAIEEDEISDEELGDRNE